MRCHEKRATLREREFNRLRAAYGLPPVPPPSSWEAAFWAGLRWRASSTLAIEGKTLRSWGNRRRSEEEFRVLLSPEELEHPDYCSAVIDMWRRWRPGREVPQPTVKS